MDGQRTQELPACRTVLPRSNTPAKLKDGPASWQSWSTVVLVFVQEWRKWLRAGSPGRNTERLQHLHEQRAPAAHRQRAQGSVLTDNMSKVIKIGVKIGSQGR
eukprot:1117640-Pelagomonas_calceolata.AAC.6